MALSAVDLFGRLILDDKGFQQSVKRSAEKAGATVGTSLGSRVTSGLAKSLGASVGTAGAVGRAFSGVEKATNRMGSAFSHAGGRVKELLSGPLGILGLGAGLLTIGGAVESSVHELNDFSLTVEKLTGLTGDSAENMSGILAVLQKFGIDSERTAKIVGFLEKTLGNLTATSGKGAVSAEKLAKANDGVTKAEERLRVARLRLAEIERKGGASSSQLAAARFRVADASRALSEAETRLRKSEEGVGTSTTKAAALQKQYGVALTDSKGRALTFQQILLNVADYYTSNAQASDKAALAAKLFGRGYADLIPVLKLGRKGILDAESAAAELGETLTGQNVADLAKYRESMREGQSAVRGLQLQVALTLVPTLTHFFGIITSWLKTGGRDQIVSFFREGAKFAEGLGSAIEHDVIPVFKGIDDAWNGVPAPLRDLLIKGFVAGKVSKFLFDFGPIDLGKAIIGKFGGDLFSKGGSPANPLFVKDVAGGLGGGLAGETGAKGGLASMLKFTAALALGAVALDLWTTNLAPLNDHIAEQTRDIEKNTEASFGTVKSMADLQSELDGARQGLNDFNQTTSNLGPLQEVLYGSQKKALEESVLEIQREIEARKKGTTTFASQGHETAAADRVDKESWASINHWTEATASGVVKMTAAEQALHVDFVRQRAILEHSLHPADLAKAATKIAADIVHGVGNLRNTNAVLGQLRHALSVAIRNGDHDAATRIRAAIAKVEAKIPGRAYITHQIALAQKLVASSKATHDKIVGLQRIETDLKRRGDTHAARIVQRLILAQRAINATTAAVNRTTAAVFAHPINTGPGPGKAAGGPVSANSAQPVGEKGPELFVPKIAGVVLPNWLLRSLAGVNAATETINQYISVPVDGLVRAETPGDIARILRQVGNSGVLRPRRRFSTYSTRRKLALGDV